MDQSLLGCFLTHVVELKIHNTLDAFKLIITTTVTFEVNVNN